jgi:integrase
LRPVGKRQRSAATANKIRSQLVALWNFAHRKKLCATGPDVPKLTEAKRVATSWGVEEIGRILDACDRHPKGVVFRALVLVLFDTGLRLGALRKAPLSAYSSATRELLIAAETQKQKADQLFVLHEDTCAALALLPTGRATLIPLEMSEATLFNKFREVLRDAGLPATRRDMFHKIRRTTATLVEQTYGAGTATRVLGHSSPGVTAAYLDTTKLPGNDIALRMPRPTKPATPTK